MGVRRSRRPAAQLVINSYVPLLADGQGHRVVWRGKQVLPSARDWPGEIAVYRLDNDY